MWTSTVQPARHPITGRVELWEDHWQTPKCIAQHLGLQLLIGMIWRSFHTTNTETCRVDEKHMFFFGWKLKFWRSFYLFDRIFHDIIHFWYVWRGTIQLNKKLYINCIYKWFIHIHLHIHPIFFRVNFPPGPEVLSARHHCLALSRWSASMDVWNAQDGWMMSFPPSTPLHPGGPSHEENTPEV